MRVCVEWMDGEWIIRTHTHTLTKMANATEGPQIGSRKRRRRRRCIEGLSERKTRMQGVTDRQTDRQGCLSFSGPAKEVGRGKISKSGFLPAKKQQENQEGAASRLRGAKSGHPCSIEQVRTNSASSTY